MRLLRLPVLATCAALALGLTAGPARAQQGEASEPLTVEAVVQRIYQTESGLIARMRELQPMVEAYIQDMAPADELGGRPMLDTYFLGRFRWDDEPKLDLLVDTAQGRNVQQSRIDYLPDGFAGMAVPDWEALNPARYDFTFVRREFLGEARTFVFDVAPRRSPNDGFTGRIWVEDRDFHIVRFNGINRRTGGNWFRRRLTFHVEGWRVNTAPGVWVPAYVYCEEGSDLSPTTNTALHFKSQIRFWGYAPEVTDLNSAFTAIEILEPAILDAGQPSQLAPVESQRRWEEEAEANLLERLQRARLLAPPGGVEDVLDTVLNNLVVTNDVMLDRQIKARVLLTSPLESFTLGRTIVLSRGLIDVLPNEASLAMMLAHELAHIVLGHQLIDTRFAYTDRLMISDTELLGQMALHRPGADEVAADELALQMLARSPYAAQMPEAGLFVRILAERAASLPNLLLPHVGDPIANGASLRLAGLTARAPELEPENLEQIPALSLGARLYVDPWSGRLELLQGASMSPGTIREKAPLEVTPLTPYITYAETQAAR